MLLNWKNVESLVKPLLVDDTLSKKGVYYRKDIEEVTEDDVTKYVYKEVVLSNDFRFNIKDVDEYVQAIKDKIDEINSELHITKLDFYTNLCLPASISYETLSAKIAELGMQAQWDLCNHVYYGVIKPFLAQLPLGKTEEEIIAIFEELMQNSKDKLEENKS